MDYFNVPSAASTSSPTTTTTAGTAPTPTMTSDATAGVGVGMEGASSERKQEFGLSSSRSSKSMDQNMLQSPFFPADSSTSSPSLVQRQQQQQPPVGGAALFGPPTANPFTLGHPTAFPVQNGASAGFQQALLARRSQAAASSTSTSTSTSIPAPAPAPATVPQTPGAGPESHSSSSNNYFQQALAYTTGSSSGFSSPGGRSQKRHHHPSSHSHKSVRTPILSSPRQVGSQSPTSPSSSPASSRGSSPAATPASAFHLHHPGNFKGLPRVALSAATPAAAAPSSATIARSSSASTTSEHFSRPLLLLSSSMDKTASAGPSSQPNAFVNFLAHRSGPSAASSSAATTRVSPGSISGLTAGASTTSTASTRRGTAVNNPRFKSVSVPEGIQAIVASPAFTASDLATRTLVLDLRPHTAYVAQGRLRTSINICVPSTLLRRPNFSLVKIAETLSSKRDRHAFSSALGLNGAGQGEGRQTDKILIIDQESNFLSNESLLHSLLAKLDMNGYKGELCWLKGGFSALQKYLDENDASQLGSLADVVDLHVLSETEEEESETDDEIMSDAEQAQRMGGPGLLQVPTAISPAGQQQQLRKAALDVAGGRSSSPSVSSGSRSGSGSTGSDSLFPSSFGSSSTSSLDESAFPTGSHPQKSSSLPTFDRSKLALPFMPGKRGLGSRLANSLADKTAAAETPESPVVGAGAGSVAGAASAHRAVAKSSSTPVIRPKNLPLSAFQSRSTAAGQQNSDDAVASSLSHPASSGMRKSSSAQSRRGSPNLSLRNLTKAANPVDMRGKSTSPAAPAFGLKQAANPFFDNIRQNIEAQDLETVLKHVQPMHIPPEFLAPELVNRLPPFLQDLTSMTPRSRSVKINTEYFDIEQNEQKRLQRVLDWHCSQGIGVVTDSDKSDADESGDEYHPFSISAGVEKGHLNRYKNMWPYEHARVRLRTEHSPSTGDYVNASHIRLRGTARRYIASQGPLEATTEHFWQLVLQENVSTIVMLTLLAEGGREKCYNYFKSATYDSVSVELKEEVGHSAAMRQSINDNVGFFGMEVQATPEEEKAHNQFSISKGVGQGPSKPTGGLDASTVRRTLEIRDLKNPNRAPHRVTHIQYIRWPDFDIPPDPNCLIHLIHETQRARELGTDQNAPVLVHCSAGVGRTGTFIAVETLLERYKRERRLGRSASISRARKTPESFMDVDGQTESPQPLSREASPAGTPSSIRRQARAGSSTSNSDTMQAMTLNSDTESSPILPSASAFSAKSASMSADTGAADNTALLRRLKTKQLLPEDHTDPIKSLVDQMREQRMSSVANAGQYVFTYLALIAGIQSQLEEEGTLTA